MDSYAGITCRLAAGWNTWNTRSVLSHVLLPEGIAINIGFKHYAGGDYLKEALIGRRGEHNEKIHPGLRTYDGTYTDLRLSWKGRSWRVQTAATGDEWVMLVTPLAVAVTPEHGHVHENYCADSGQGCNVERSDAFYHWGGLLGLIERVDH